MRFFDSLFVSLSGFLSCALIACIHADPLNCSVSAESAILINADTGMVLFEKNVSAQHFPASITKIATALYALKQKPEELDTKLVAEQDAIGSITPSAKRKNNYKKPAYWIETGSTHIGIKKGEELPFRDLLHAILVASANDASNIVAQYIGKGSIEHFIEGLNAYLKEIGCQETHFLNPHGLHHPDHKTSARDMALIAREAMKIQLFSEIVAKKNYVCAKTNKQPARPIAQSNLLLKKGSYYYEKAIGIKNGYTSDAGHTLVAAAREGDRTLIAVVLACNERQETCQDVITLFNAAFSEVPVKQSMLKKGLQQHQLAIEGASSLLQTYLVNDFELEYFPSEEQDVKAILQWKNELILPVHENDQVGSILLYRADDKLIADIPLLAYSDVKPSFWFSLKSKLGKLSEWSVVARGTLLLGIISVITGVFWWLKGRKRLRYEVK
ncbi:MAG: D-alanyl-D-alanine carboxypeptidase [Chlamydiales bacterium]|nr:D-alanyl-D-alanine carboxypeptidase [Chlamydiales bacterium]